LLQAGSAYTGDALDGLEEIAQKRLGVPSKRMSGLTSCVFYNFHSSEAAVSPAEASSFAANSEDQILGNPNYKQRYSAF
jgi:hypothetical protein